MGKIDLIVREIKTEKEIKDAIGLCHKKIQDLGELDCGAVGMGTGGEDFLDDLGAQITCIKNKLSVLRWVLGSKCDSSIDELDL